MCCTWTASTTSALPYTHRRQMLDALSLGDILEESDILHRSSGVADLGCAASQKRTAKGAPDGAARTGDQGDAFDLNEVALLSSQVAQPEPRSPPQWYAKYRDRRATNESY